MANLVMLLGEGATEYDFLTNTIIEALTGGLKYRLSEAEIPLRDGVAVATASKSAREIGISGMAVADTQALLQTKRDNLEQALNRKARQKWRIFDDRYIWVWLQSYSIAEISGGAYMSFAWHLTLIADDPYFESVTENQITNSASIVVTNNGNAPAWPIYAITAPVGGLTSAVMGNSTTGKSLTWSKSPAMPLGQILTVNMLDQTMDENGTKPLINLSAGDFWSISPGNNTVTFTSNPASAAYTMKWRDRWN